MERRAFLGACALLSGAALAPGAGAADAPPRLYARTRLVDAHGAPIARSRHRARHELRLPVSVRGHAVLPAAPRRAGRAGRDAEARRTAARTRGRAASARERTVVAFSAICAHKLAYPTRDVSFIRYQPQRSPTSSGNVIHCCADHSVYDPAEGARVVAGPAPQPLAAIVLEYDASSDGLFAIGTRRRAVRRVLRASTTFKLALEYGSGKARAPVERHDASCAS